MKYPKKSNYRRSFVVAALVFCIGAACLVGSTWADRDEQGGWVAGDFHQHTTYTDGANSLKTVMYKNNQFGLDWWANSEHGGASGSDARGPLTINGPYNVNGGIPWSAYKSGTILGNPNGTNMWRWQVIRDYSFWDAMYTGALLSKPVIQGLEWNVPAHEHCSTGIIANQFDPSNPNANPVAQFEYLFDKSDTDTSQSAVWGAKLPNNHAKAVAAITWMQTNYPKQAWMVPAHVERKQPGSAGGYYIKDFRDFNNAGPDVCFGFESMPGHQKEYSVDPNNGVKTGRGGYSETAVGGGTYGGTGTYAAQVGGLWDALLGEGRNWWLFASSDFHDTDADFWPGEYQKTYTYVANKKDPQAIVDGLRSGNSFVVEGDLIDGLDFVASSGGRYSHSNDSATMGQTLAVERNTQSNTVRITIGFHSPEKNNNGDHVKVDHIDLIAGSVFNKIDPSDTTTYNTATNPSTRVIATFFRKDWKGGENGWYYIQYETKVTTDAYFRLRGTNLPRNTPNQTDAAGNPLPDFLVGPNNAQEAFKDLWFYSDPIFVRMLNNQSK
jgi:hypothetical protein